MEKQAYELHRELEKTLKFFRKGEAMPLREHSNALMKRAVLLNSGPMAQVSIVAYVLHKLLTKEHIVRHERWKQNKASLSDSIQSALLVLEGGNVAEFTRSMASFAGHVKKIDGFFSRFMQGLMEKARVKCASDAYFFGMSLGSAAELAGADKKRLQEFIGATGVHDKERSRMGIAERLNSLKAAIAV
jgi:hypothetical protein